MSDTRPQRPSLASECTESLASRPLDGASAGGMPVGRVEFSSPAARRVDWPFPNAEDRGTAHLDAEIERLNASLRAEGAAEERERLRLELLAEADRRLDFTEGASALRDFARRLEPVTASAYVDGQRISATAATPEEADAELTRLAGLEGK